VLKRRLIHCKKATLRIKPTFCRYTSKIRRYIFKNEKNIYFKMQEIDDKFKKLICYTIEK